MWKSRQSSVYLMWGIGESEILTACVLPCFKVVLASIWLLGFIIAAVPLMNEDVFGNYYGRNGVCFPLHSDRQEKPTAKGYSTGIFLGKSKSLFLTSFPLNLSDGQLLDT